MFTAVALQVLQTILGLERLDRMTAFAQELALGALSSPAPSSAGVVSVCFHIFQAGYKKQNSFSYSELSGECLSSQPKKKKFSLLRKGMYYCGFGGSARSACARSQSRATAPQCPARL